MSLHCLECLLVLPLHQFGKMGPRGKSVTRVEDVNHLSETFIIHH